MWSYMANSNSSTPAQYLIILLDLARQRGVAANAMLAGTELTEAGLATIGPARRAFDGDDLADHVEILHMTRLDARRLARFQ